jgi:hypothetical protein
MTLMERRASQGRKPKAAVLTCGLRKREPLAFSLAVFEHACGYRPVYRALVGGQGGVVAINEISRVLSDTVRDELWAYSGQNAVSRDLALEFVVSTFLTVLG